MSATRSPRRARTLRSAHPGGAGRFDVRAQLAQNYRLWAQLPADVHALLALGPPRLTPGDADPILAAVPRPLFPPGVCTGCGCSEHDACPGPFDEGCAWIDRTRTRCSACGPVPTVRARARRRA